MRREKQKKYGKCTNEKCENYKQVVPISGGNMVCAKCKCNLMECPPPPPPFPWKKYVAIACGVAVLGAGVYGICDRLNSKGQGVPTPNPGGAITSGGSGPTTNLGEPKGRLAKEPVKTGVTITSGGGGSSTNPKKPAGEPAKKPVNTGNTATKQKKPAAGTGISTAVSTPPVAPGALNLGYATYTGQTKNGKPHGVGKLVYKKPRKIVASQSYEASPGDTYVGQFRDGKVNGGPGTWTHNGVSTPIVP